MGLHTPSLRIKGDAPTLASPLLDPDSDGNGISDGDGGTNHEEEVGGTDPSQDEGNQPGDDSPPAGEPPANE